MQGRSCGISSRGFFLDGRLYGGIDPGRCKYQRSVHTLCFPCCCPTYSVRTKAVPEALFKLIGEKIPGERFYELVHRAWAEWRRHFRILLLWG